MTSETTARDADYLKEIDKARRQLRAIISSKNCAPLMLRLALHDAATFDVNDKTGGPNGSIRNPVEHSHEKNKGLDKAVAFCEEVKKEHKNVTYADLYQLAGVVAVEAAGGPTINFVPGRQDSLKSPPEGRLPDVKQDVEKLKNTFHRMGITHDKDIVALLGGFEWVNKYKDRSSGGDQNTNDNATVKFDNFYFKELREKASKKDLLNEFSQYVEQYEKDEDAFFKDYAAAHKKLSELGTNLNKPFGDHRMIHGVIGIFIASTAVILGYLFRVHRRG